MPDSVVSLSWARHVPRSRNIARAVGARDHYVEYGKRLPLLLTPVRYLLQGAKTIGILLRERPAVVLAMNPPFVCPLIAYVYTRITGGRLVIDSGHTGAFGGRWRRFFFIQEAPGRVLG